MAPLSTGTRVSADPGTVSALLRGFRIGSLAFLLATIGFGIVELRDHPERWLAWTVANAVNLGLCATAFWARRVVRTPTQARALSVFVVLCIASVMTGYTTIEHGPWRMLAMGLIILLAGLSLLAPLGLTAQGLVAVGAVTIYAGPLIFGVQPDVPMGLPFVALISGAAVSVLGAYLTERYRAEWMAAGAAARSAADVATTLIDIGRELNTTLSRAQVLRRLADRAADIFGAPIGAINLIDEHHRMQIVEVCGLSEEEASAARHLYVDLDGVPGAWNLLAEPLIEVPNVSAQAGFLSALLQQFGYHGLLIAPLHRGEKILGAVAFMYREPRAPFTEHERQLARGLAE